MNCPNCKSPVAAHATSCRHCGTALGFPNVRAARAPAEVAALRTRYDQARADARARNAEAPLARFEEAVRTTSRAIIYRPLKKLNELIDSGNGLFQTFYRQVGLGRVPEDNKWDRFRAAVDGLFFPYYHERVHFAALTIGTKGAASYGAGRGCALRLNETIENRATVFEENTFDFCETTRHPATEPLPLGLRAAWADRHLLAVAKLGHRVPAAARPGDFPDILIVPGTNGDDQFIEVHIHDPLTEAAVELARLPKVKPGLTRTKDKVEKALLKAVREKLEALQVPCEVV